jgi:hypothetical protein
MTISSAGFIPFTKIECGEIFGWQPIYLNLSDESNEGNGQRTTASQFVERVA